MEGVSTNMFSRIHTKYIYVTEEIINNTYVYRKH